MFLQAQGIVAVAIETLGRHAAKVANTWHRDRDQAVQEFVHPHTAQSHFCSKRHIFTHPEASDRLLCFRNNGILTGDQSQVLLRRFGFFRIAHRFRAATDIHHNLVELWQHHCIGIAKLFHECRTDGSVVFSS